MGYIKNEFELAKEMGSGTGQKLRRSYPDAWKKAKNQPDELLAKVKFDIQVIKYTEIRINYRTNTNED